MGTQAGLWIDHKKAVIVTITDNREEIAEVMSKVETQPRRTGDSPLKGPYEPHQVKEQDSLQRALTDRLNAYYDAVIESIRDAQSLLIMGPGGAKGELVKRMEKNKIKGSMAGIETVDKMTDRQIASKVRKFFQEGSDL